MIGKGGSGSVARRIRLQLEAESAVFAIAKHALGDAVDDGDETLDGARFTPSLRHSIESTKGRRYKDRRLFVCSG